MHLSWFLCSFHLASNFFSIHSLRMKHPKNNIQHNAANWKNKKKSFLNINFRNKTPLSTFENHFEARINGVCVNGWWKRDIQSNRIEQFSHSVWATDRPNVVLVNDCKHMTTFGYRCSCQLSLFAFFSFIKATINQWTQRRCIIMHWSRRKWHRTSEK